MPDESTVFLAIDHVQLGMPQGGEDAARAFYAGVLGLDEVDPPPALSGWWFRAGGVELHLNTEDGFRAGRRAHPALRVRGLAALVARCEAARHPPRWDTRYPGRQRCYVKDPFGNEVELLELAPDPTSR